jgi:hypothetical protein
MTRSPMSLDLRTIALLAEVVFPPRELRAQDVQTIHNELYTNPRFCYQNFAVGNGGIQLSNIPMRPGWISTANFLPDRIQVREELTGATVEDFKERFAIVIGKAIQRLSITQTGAAQCAVRALTNPRCFTDSRDYIARGIGRIEAAAMQSFGRPASSLGFKMFFPQTSTHGNFFALRIESFQEDPRSLFLENVGTFTQLQLPDGLRNLGNCMQETYDFLQTSTCEFLSRFDRDPSLPA